MKATYKNPWIKTSLLFLSFLFLNGCYSWHVFFNQVRLISQRVSIEEALEDYDFGEAEERKLKLIPEIKIFARETLGINMNEGIYTTYVQLDRPYVTYLLRVSRVYELKSHTWWFPIVGSVSYKGFFNRKRAEKEAKTFPPEEYDTLVRGVTAYSTLGWFVDPVLSSMLSYSESDFVVTVFHELAHTVLFFKNQVNFNERFAEFVGRKAGEEFFLKKEGKNSKTLKAMKAKWEDELLFSSFMEKEYKLLDQWYKNNKGEIIPEMKEKRLKEIQERFVSQIQSKLKTRRYSYFSKIRLNNAVLLSYRTYNYKMEEFEKLYIQSDRDIKTVIHRCSQFKDERNPEEALSRFVSRQF